MIDCEHNDCTFYSNRTVCCLAEVIQGRTIDCLSYTKKGGLMRWTTCTLFGSQFCFQCNQCLERKNMPNIKITAEVNGKQVPLKTVSTETFEAIKALEKPKEIPVPVARVGHYKDLPQERRLFLKEGNRIVIIDLERGCNAAVWSIHDDDSHIHNYENVKPL